jgi:phage-related protein
MVCCARQGMGVIDNIAKMIYVLFMKQWTVEFLNQTVEAEFDRFPAEIRAKTVHISNLIREFGLPNIGLPYIRHIQDKIWEIRALQGRSLYITAASQRIIILRCFIKKTGKLPRKELNIALKRAGEIKHG